MAIGVQRDDGDRGRERLKMERGEERESLISLPEAGRVKVRRPEIHAEGRERPIVSGWEVETAAEAKKRREFRTDFPISKAKSKFVEKFIN